MTYIQRASDKAYRRVNLNNNASPEFVKFGGEHEEVSYPENTVLEIEHRDGSTELIYEYERKIISLRKFDGRIMCLGKCPTNHLYLKEQGGNTLYALPTKLPYDAVTQSFYVEVTQGVELKGDRYFEAAYTLVDA